MVTGITPALENVLTPPPAPAPAAEPAEKDQDDSGAGRRPEAEAGADHGGRSATNARTPRRLDARSA